MSAPPAWPDAWRAAPLAEIAWRTGDGRADATVVVPLTRGGEPVLALPYAERSLATQLAAADEVVLALVHPTLARTPPMSVVARCHLHPDPHGEAFLERLLDQELAKHPPSRRRVDSPLLRREHWWYVPRLLLELTATGPVHRHAAAGAVIASAAPSGLSMTTLPDPSDEVTGLELPDGPAVVLQHGATTPDLDPRWERRRYGAVHAGVFRTTSIRTDGYPERAPSLWRRWRDEAAYARRCRAELASVGRR